MASVVPVALDVTVPIRALANGGSAERMVRCQLGTHLSFRYQLRGFELEAVR